MVSWILWIGILVGVTLLYFWLWRFAKKIEEEELVEAQIRQYDEDMNAYLAWLWQNDPTSAYYYQQQYDQERGSRKY